MGVDAFLKAVEAGGFRGDVVTAQLDAWAQDEGDVPPVCPEAVLVARRAADIAPVLRAAQAHRVPVTPRAAGSNRVGSARPVPGGVVLAMSGLDQVVDVDVRNQVAIVEPGVVLDALDAVLAQEGLFYAPDPNSSAYCCLGGTIGTNAAGPRSYKYGVTREHVLGLDVVFGDGQSAFVGRRTRKGVAGYDLTALLVGSEGTLAVTTQATLKLLPRPQTIHTLLVYFTSLAEVAGAVQALSAARLGPRCIELMDGPALAILRASGQAVRPDAEAALLVEFDDAGSKAEQAANVLADLGAVSIERAVDAAQRDALWAVRKSLSRTLRERARYKLSEDVVVPVSAMADLIATCAQLSEREGLDMPTYGHAGDGNLHVNVLWNDESEKPKVGRITDALFRRTLELGGTLTGEHGIGLTKRDYLPLEQPAHLIDKQRALKAIFDPAHILNPDKVFNTHHGPC